MSKLLLNLRHVPEDEADDVRELLEAGGIEFYETRPSIWGVSGGGIFITDDASAGKARRLMDEYQARRRTRVRAKYAAARRDGTAETFWTILRAEPARVALALLAIVCLLALVALPVVLLRG